MHGPKQPRRGIHLSEIEQGDYKKRTSLPTPANEKKGKTTDEDEGQSF